MKKTKSALVKFVLVYVITQINKKLKGWEKYHFIHPFVTSPGALIDLWGCCRIDVGYDPRRLMWLCQEYQVVTKWKR